MQTFAHRHHLATTGGPPVARRLHRLRLCLTQRQHTRLDRARHLPVKVIFRFVGVANCFGHVHFKLRRQVVSRLIGLAVLSRQIEGHPRTAGD